MHLKPTAALALALLLFASAARAEPAHGIALHGAPKQPADFAHFSYVNPDAPKGGRLMLGALRLLRQPQPADRQGRRRQRHPRVRHREPDGARPGRAVHALRPASPRPSRCPRTAASITFNLNPKARFSDGHPITADDVLFSFELLKQKGRPNHRTYFAKVAKAESCRDRSVRFTFDAAGDREMPLILGPDAGAAQARDQPRHLREHEPRDRRSARGPTASARSTPGARSPSCATRTTGAAICR